MDNFKEYRRVKKFTYAGEYLAIILMGLSGLTFVLNGETVQGLSALGLGCAILFYVFLLKKMSGKIFAQLDNGVLKYYENDELVGEWNVKETEIAYNATLNKTLHGIKEFDLLIIHGEDDVEILTCTQLDYLELYNDIMELQGKEKKSSVDEF